MVSREWQPGRARRALVGVLLLTLGLVVLPPSDAALPTADVPVDVQIVPDADGDRIDDLLTRVWSGAASGTFADGLKRLRFDMGPEGLVFDVFVRFTGGVDGGQAERVAFVAGGREVRVFPLAESVWVRGVPYALLDDLLAVPGALAIQSDRVVLPATELDAQTHMVRASERFGRGATERFRVTGRGVTVAVLDTGVDGEHRTFAIDKGIGGYDATHWFLRDNATNRRDPDSEDTITHGTYVAGVALGAGLGDVDPTRPFDTGPITYVRKGVAPDARYVDVKVMTTDPDGNAFGLGSDDVVAGSSSMVLEGLEFVRRFNAGGSHLGNVTPREIEVVLMALSETEPDPGGNSTLAYAVDNLTAQTGVIVVAAAGNCGPGAATAESVWDVLYRRCTRTGPDSIGAPGSAQSAITVAALDIKETLEWEDDEIALFSSMGPAGGERKPNVAASGVQVEGPLGRPTKRDELYRWEPAGEAFQNLSGTSASAAVVAGIAALLKEAAPRMTPERAKEILMLTARDVEQKGWDPISGAGAVDAYDAVGVAFGLLDESLFNGTKEDGPKADPVDVPRPPVAPRPRLNAPPDVVFTATPQPALTAERIRFVDRSTDRNGDPLKEWSWDFGDGETGKGENVTHVYRRPGVYLVRLSVTDGNKSQVGVGVGRQDVVVQGPALARDSPGAAVPVALLLIAVLVSTLRVVTLRAAASGGEAPVAACRGGPVHRRVSRRRRRRFGPGEALK